MGREVAAKLDGLLPGGEEMGAAIGGEGVLKGVEKFTKRGGEAGTASGSEPSKVFMTAEKRSSGRSDMDAYMKAPNSAGVPA